LTAAVLAARAGSNGGLALVVATLAGNATDALQGIGEAIPLGFAFGRAWPRRSTRAASRCCRPTLGCMWELRLANNSNGQRS
jgi:hypothetical protein